MFAPIDPTPFSVLTLTLPADLRFSYGFLPEAVEGGRPQLADDPYNRHRDTRDGRLAGPVAVLPEAEQLAFPPLDAASPALEEITWDSAILENSRSVWVSLPPDAPRGEPLPFVVLFDGAERHLAPFVRDQVVGGGKARPHAIVLVDEAGRREQELPGNPEFSRALVEELLPRVREQFELSTEPDDAVLAGSSFGGLCAGWTALRYPHVFGTAIMQSPSCWYHPTLMESQAPATTTPVPVLLDAFMTTPAAPIRLWQECGSLEFGPPPARVWQVLGNRWLHGLLVDRGYDTVYREFAGAHDAVWWRGTFADALSWALPIS
jgi:enterochelin esterase family protein